MYSTLLTTLQDGIFIITINRPDKLNAINKQVMADLDAALNEVYTNKEIKSAIITGSGKKAFAAGADIIEFTELTKEEGIALAKKGQNVFFKIENSYKPIIAAVNGFALGGGCELAMACHFRLCSDNAKFGQPEVNLGLVPGYGGTQRLAQLVGKGKAMELLMSGAIINADEALQYGLVNYVTTIDVLLNKTKDILTVIQNKAPLAVAKIIDCVNASVTNDKSGYNKEIESFGDCFASEDMKEGTAAFLEKRTPHFKGK